LGFSKEDKKVVFKEFKKLSAKPTGDESSTGFGLAIVKKIIDKHGGSIKLDMEKVAGSRFIIKLPFIID
jgi:signal transduction histidine kinase